MEKTNLTINVVGRTYNHTVSQDTIVKHKYGRVVIGQRVANSLSLGEGSNIVFGELNDNWYLCSSITGIPQSMCFSLRRAHKTSTNLEFNSKAVAKLAIGSYHLGAGFEDATGKVWYPLIKEE